MEIGIGLIALLVIVSGLIAYIGDLVGRRVGKRRVSLLGLRPKHSSIVVTIITGVVIVSLTLGVLLAISSQARKAFFGLKQLEQQLDEREQALDKLEQDYQNLDTKYREEEERLKESISKTTEALEQSRASLESKQSELDDILGEINLKSVELEELQESTEELKKKVTALDTQRGELEEKIKSLKLEHASSIGETSREVLFGDIIYRKGEPLARTIIPIDMQVQEVEKRMAGILSKVFRDAIEHGALVENETSLLFQQQMMSLLDVLKESDQPLIVEVRSHSNVFKGQPLYVTLNVLDNTLVFKQNEVIEKDIVESGLSQVEVSRILNSMLTRASTDARRAGMVPDPELGRVGSIPAKRYVEIVGELTDMEEAKTIELYAVEDTYLSDRLNVDFRVSR